MPTPAHAAARAAAPHYAHLEFCQVVDSAGVEIGLLEQLYLDAENHLPLWAQVIGGFHHMRRMLVPLTGATLPEVNNDEAAEPAPQPGASRITPGAPPTVRVAVTREQAQTAPILDATDGLSAAEEAQLRTHYGIYSR